MSRVRAAITQLLMTWDGEGDVPIPLAVEHLRKEVEKDREQSKRRAQVSRAAAKRETKT